jgi:hypothetical protein
VGIDPLAGLWKQAPIRLQPPKFQSTQCMASGPETESVTGHKINSSVFDVAAKS